MKIPTFPKETVYEIIYENKYKVNEPNELSHDQYGLLQRTERDFGFEILHDKLLEIFKQTSEGPHIVKKPYNGAVLQITGAYSVHSQGVVNVNGKEYPYRLFVIHNSLQNAQNKLLSKLLIEKKLVKLFEGCDEDYLYQALSETADKFFYETIQAYAKGLPIFSVVFKDDGRYDVEEMGKVTEIS